MSPASSRWAICALAVWMACPSVPAESAEQSAVTVVGGDTVQIIEDAYWLDESNVPRRQTNLFKFVGPQRDIVRLTDMRGSFMHDLKVSPTMTKIMFLRSSSTADVPQEMLCVYDLADMRLIKVPVSAGKAEWSADGSTIVATARSLHRGKLGDGRWVVVIDPGNGRIVAGKRVWEQ